MNHKDKQERIDRNGVADLDMDKMHMINYLSEQVSDEQLIIIKDHYESLTDNRLLKLESAFWLILIWKELYKRDHRIIKNDQGQEF
jgi:hypothetical protein|tara:strand:- start:678 stop:935 length:258 start_codon:yes stop_codon:yes gene_type:complete